MMILGHIENHGRVWIAEAPDAGVFTQGHDKADLLEMVVDAFESVVDRPGFEVTVAELDDAGTIGITSNDDGALFAHVLRTMRASANLSLADVAERLGASSRNAYSQYERGKALPSISKARELLAAVSGTRIAELVIQSRPRRADETLASAKPGTGKRR